MQVRDTLAIPAGVSVGRVAPRTADSLSAGRSPSVDISDIQQEVTAIFDVLREPVLRHLLSMGLSVPDGEDVVQDTFLALFNHLRRGRPRTNLRGWVFRTAHNLGLKKRKVIHKAWKTDRMMTDEFPAADPRTNPEQRLSDLQRYNQLSIALQSLPERDLFCLSLRAEGLKYREIARAIGISLGSVSNSIRRAAVLLQQVRR